MTQDPKDTRTSSGMDIPDYAIQRIARCMFPMIQRYYESEEGRRELTKWKQSKELPKGK